MSAEVLQKSLEVLQFADKGHEHAWNDFQMERDFADLGTIKVWAQRWPQIRVQWYQGDDCMIDDCWRRRSGARRMGSGMIELGCTENIDIVVRIVMMTIHFLAQLGTANASPAPERSTPEANNER